VSYTQSPYHKHVSSESCIDVYQTQMSTVCYTYIIHVCITPLSDTVSCTCAHCIMRTCQLHDTCIHCILYMCITLLSDTVSYIYIQCIMHILYRTHMSCYTYTYIHCVIHIYVHCMLHMYTLYHPPLSDIVSYTYGHCMLRVYTLCHTHDTCIHFVMHRYLQYHPHMPTVCDQYMPCFIHMCITPLSDTVSYTCIHSIICQTYIHCIMCITPLSDTV
jgi:hypothetical protein